MTLDAMAGSFEALIFDCDGTLVDTAPAHLSALRVAFGAHELSIEDAWYFERVGLSPKALLDAYEIEFGTLPVSRSLLLAPYTDAYQTNLNSLREVTIVADMARVWKDRVPMAVASNGQRENVRGSLRAVGLLHLFDHIVGIEDVTHGKPAPDIFLEAARRMHTAPGATIVLEDSDEGLEAAHAAGMRSIDIRKLWTPAWKTR